MPVREGEQSAVPFFLALPIFTDNEDQASFVAG